MYDIDFLNKYYVTVQGDGNLYTELQEYYDHLVKTDTASDPDLRIRECDSPPEPEAVLGSPKRYFGRKDDLFIIKSLSNHVAISSDWNRLLTSPGTNPYWLKVLIEFRVRKEMAEDGYAIIHGSGVKLCDQITLFPAWRHTGKTNTMLSLLEDGGGYLADDRVWVHESGETLGYPLPVNMLPYNFNSFPDLVDVSKTDEIRQRMHEKINHIVNRERSILDKAVYFINRFYIDPDLGKVISLNELLPKCNFVDSGGIDQLVFLRTNTEWIEGGPVEKEEMDASEALRNLETTSYHEWNQRLESFTTAHRMLFNDDRWVEELDNLKSREVEIFQSMLSNVDISRLELPREEEWREAGLTQRIRHVINES